MKRKTKKGLTLIELIISTAFISVIMIIATMSIILSYKSLSLSSVSADIYTKTFIAEDSLIQYAKNAISIKILPLDAAAPHGYSSFYVSERGFFVLGNIKAEDIEDITVRISPSANRAKLDYSITVDKDRLTKSKHKFEGGLILNNISLDKLISDGILSEGEASTDVISLRDYILYIK